MDLTSTRRLGGTELSLSPLGLGGAPLGDLYEQVPETAAQDTLAQAYELGVRFFDTAPWYGHGQSEHRFGHYLRQQPRDTFLLSTKVGRVYRSPDDTLAPSVGPWVGGLPFQPSFDYGYDGIMRSYQDSLQRLGLNRVDMLVIHDLDYGYHLTDAAVEEKLRELEQGGWRALCELKAAGRIKAIGAGINEMSMMTRFLDRFDLDFFLVAMPYTLLDQRPLAEVFPRCQAANVGIIVGAPYASGILATGAIVGAKYNYARASAEVVERVQRIEAVCAEHGVPLAAAALQFPLGHTSVAAVIPGAISAGQVAANLRLIKTEIPAEFWQQLKDQRLIDAAAPV